MTTMRGALTNRTEGGNVQRSETRPSAGFLFAAQGDTDSPSWATLVVSPKRRMDRSGTLHKTRTERGPMATVDFI